MIILIAAIGKNRELGRGSELVWRLKGDLRRFKELTLGHAVIMGRKTFESIGRILPKRVNIIVTRDTTFHQDGAVVVHSVEQALETAKNLGTEDIYVIGGGEIYLQTLPYADQLELTLVDSEAPGANVFFPEFENKFEEVSKEKPREENGVSYTWTTYKRKTT